MAKLTATILRRINEKTIQAAGARYTPALDADAPNLEIRSLQDAIHALALSDDYQQAIRNLADDLREAYSSSRYTVSKIFARRKLTPEKLVQLLKDQLVSESAGSSRATLRRIRYVTDTINRQVQRRESALWKVKTGLRSSSRKSESIDSERHNLRKMQSALSQITAFCGSPSFGLIEQNRMFIRGEWGTGKTHFLCDVTRRREQAGLPTLFLLAHRLDGTDPLNAVCRAIKRDLSGSDLLSCLDELGKKSGGRSLIIIDGINEADREMWRHGLAKVARQVRRYPNVGLVVSCRSPFDQLLLDDASRKLFVETIHMGFDEIEFDAQREFFRYYDIPNPHVPLLVPEFSRPLFLKMLCHSFSGKTASAKSRGINAIASGQKGMTKIFEDFVVGIGRGIEQDYNLAHKTCWRLLKGDRIGQRAGKIGLAVTMADGLRDYVTRVECRSVLGDWTGWTDQEKIEELLRRLVTDGLLADDLRWEDGKQTEIVRFPYQRFSDHLICRHLLETHLNCDSEQQIRRAFYKNRPLGKIFEVDRWGRTYRLPGLASAIMLEFPERVKRVLPEGEQELVFYLPKKRRLLMPLVETFLEGVLWRPQDSFSRQTEHIMLTLLRRGPRYTQEQTLEALVGLGSRFGHPFAADWLVKYLRSFSLPERDLHWSDYLRTAEESSVVYRLLDWIERTDGRRMSAPVALNVTRLCAMFLTTTRRPLRDRATKSLVAIGERSPGSLFKTTIEMLAFDDPYIGERMLAAAYGVAMRCWASASNAFVKQLEEFTRNLYDAMFAPRARHATTHILARDYAVGVIQLARKLNPQCLGRRKVDRFIEPFSKTHTCIPSAAKIRKRDCVQADAALMMDFENYTIGRLVASRGNYDYKNKEYQGVVRQIKWRIVNLGYSKEKFQQIDGNIAEANFRFGRSESGEKTDRYGKKYSWIAFFEVSGMRADRGLLPHYDETYRASECDIDPSFPSEAPEWRPKLNRYFRKSVKHPERWIRAGQPPRYDHLLQMTEVDNWPGPWVLLDGFILEGSPSDKREVFTFLRGVLVKEGDIDRLRSRFLSVDTLGNHQIPEASSDYSVFAGEVPWRRTFGSYYRTKDGRSRRHLEEAFEGHRTRTIRKRADKLSRSERKEYRAQIHWDGLIEILQRRSPEEGAKEAKAQISTPEVVEIHRFERVPGVKIEIPVASYGWSSSNSVENQAGNIEFPAPSLCVASGMKNTGNLVDLVDIRGRPASLYRVFNRNASFGMSHLIFMRRDLLSAYLRRTKQRIVWLVWGERSMHYTALEGMRGKLQPIWQSNQHVHRKMVVGQI